MNILVVEDEIRLAQSLKEILENKHHTVDIVFDGLDGFDYAISNQYDVIIMDVMLPKLNGYEVVKQLRSKNISTPIIFLSAKDSTTDKIYGLNQGADDYLSKPFDVNELLARISAISRRKGEIVLNEIKVDDLTLNINDHTLSNKTQTLNLSLKEFQLFELLFSNPKRVFSKDQIISKVWGYDSDAQDNNVEAYISFLRRKLEFLESKSTIHTIRKVGYYFGESE
jgi:DNA-binding response OmpR family regulator